MICSRLHLVLLYLPFEMPNPSKQTADLRVLAAVSRLYGAAAEKEQRMKVLRDKVEAEKRSEIASRSFIAGKMRNRKGVLEPINPRFSLKAPKNLEISSDSQTQPTVSNVSTPLGRSPSIDFATPLDFSSE